MKLQGIPEYNPPLNQEHCQNKRPQNAGRVRRRCRTVELPACAALVVLFVVALFLFAHEYSSPARRPSAPRVTGKHTCGSSVQEAKARGCVFDVMAYGWVPSQCYNGDLVGTYDAYGMSPWAFDRDLQSPAPEEVLMAGESVVLYTDLRFHQEHCFYAWHNLLHSVEHQRRLVHNLSASEEHRGHCKGLFLHGEAPTGPVVLAFFHCVDMDEAFPLREGLH